MVGDDLRPLLLENNYNPTLEEGLSAVTDVVYKQAAVDLLEIVIEKRGRVVRSIERTDRIWRLHTYL